MLRLHSHMLEFPLMKVLLESLNLIMGRLSQVVFESRSKALYCTLLFAGKFVPDFRQNTQQSLLLSVGCIRFGSR